MADLKNCTVEHKTRVREKKEMVIKAKSKLRFLHAPLLHKRKIEMNLMTPRNGVFAC